jgi:hypothetical protein
MPASGVGRRPYRWAALVRTVVAVYVLLLAAGPLDHHDVACHLKSSTHCAACVYASVPGTEARWGTALVPFVSSDLPRLERPPRPSALHVSEPGDRSPPAA